LDNPEAVRDLKGGAAARVLLQFSVNLLRWLTVLVVESRRYDFVALALVGSLIQKIA
jgi:hypothetical protein